MKVAYVMGVSAGGMGAHVAMLARGCAAAGAEVRVFAPAETGQRFFGADAGRVGFEALDVAERLRPASDGREIARLHRGSYRWSPDVVHAHGLRAGGLAALARMRGPAGNGRARRAPLVVTLHNGPPDSPGRATRATFTSLEWLVAHSADAVTWVSADLGERMRRYGAHDAGRALVPAPEVAQPSPAEVALARDAMGGPDRPVVLAVGRLAPQKGYGVLFNAAVSWQQREPKPLLALAGDGPLAGSLAALSGTLGVEVAFLGHRNDVPALMSAADVVAVPSMWEGQMVALQEALCLGRPIVATRVGGNPDLTGEDGALLVPPRDPGALAAAITAVLDDPAQAERLREAAGKRAAALPTPEDAVNAALALYRRVGPLGPPV
ncbi:MAG TPA: glycosyltransferase family 4 protein [Streptosporangiaceae bacterium]|nr:glycosyltransferase family 4 protein [Streptosporangiaceae bacterium]